MLQVERLPSNPIIRPRMDGRMGDNINGPSLIRAPEWLERPLAKYYLYFGHHQGEYIRLAYADLLEGPWSTYEPGVLPLEESTFFNHIASPDIHVDHDQREIRMYVHGVAYRNSEESEGLEKQFSEAGRWLGKQRSKVATSTDAITFTIRPEVLGASYFRVFQWRNWHYALAMPGIFARSRDRLNNFEPGPVLFTERLRHPAVYLKDETLHVFFSNAGDCPERILHSTVDLKPDWMDWRASEPKTVLKPEMDYEGVELPLEPSIRGWAPEPVRQLRDPYVFEEDGVLYLLYSVAGEQGIAIARLSGL